MAEMIVDRVFRKTGSSFKVTVVFVIYDLCEEAPQFLFKTR